MNKKGQEMSVSTIVLIVIGIIVLVMLILGFSMGWQNLWGKINIFGGGSNLDTIINSCNIAATSDSTASYCNDFKMLSKGVYVNCDYADVKAGVTKPLSCTGEPDKVKCTSVIGEAVVNTAKASVTAAVPATATEPAKPAITQEMITAAKKKITDNKDTYNGRTCAAILGVQ